MAAATDLTTSIVVSSFEGAAVTALAIDKTNGNAFTNSRGKLIARITNNNSGSDAIVATFTVTKTVPEGSGHIDCANEAVTVAAGATKVVGPWSSNFEGTGQKINVVWSGDALEGEIDLELIALP